MISGSSPVRVGVVGAGSMGGNHLRVYSTMKDVELIGVYDPDVATVDKAATALGCWRFNSLDALADEVDALSVCSPSSTHCEVGAHLLERGVHCLVEKPLATSEAECRRLIEAAEAGGAVLLVGHIERFNPAVQQVLALLENDVKVRAIEARRLSAVSGRITDVDVVADLMIHDLDIVLACVGGQVENLAARGVRKRASAGWDHVSALLPFGDGAVANVTASRITQSTVRELTVITDNGLIVVDYINQSVEMHVRDTVRPAQGGLTRFGDYVIDSTVERIAVRRTEPLRVELAHFVDCIRGRATPDVTGEQGLAAMQLVHRIQQAMG